ncbi:hypothetical protein NKJ06_33350, partial [Mesorhizobium sp. M0293]
MEEDEQKLRVRLVGRNGRRRYDPASKDRLVAACLEPGDPGSARKRGSDSHLMILHGGVVLFSEGNQHHGE